jgi:hypothetical protein
VCAGIAFAAGESFMTTETVAGESFRKSARVRKLTVLAGDFDSCADFPLGRFFVIRRSRIAAYTFS